MSSTPRTMSCPPILDTSTNYVRFNVFIIHYYRCSYLVIGSLRSLDMSYNPFEAIPIETGNLELLKELNQWDVGVGVLTALTSLNFSHCLLSEWPPQVEQLNRLISLNLSFNNIKIVPDMLSTLTSLKTLDLSNNCIHSVTSEVYHKSIAVSFCILYFCYPFTNNLFMCI